MIASVNIQSLCYGGKLAEAKLLLVLSEMHRLGIDVLCVRSTRWAGQGSFCMTLADCSQAGDREYWIHYCGGTYNEGGVAVILSWSTWRYYSSTQYVSDRMLVVVIGGVQVCVILSPSPLDYRFYGRQIKEALDTTADSSRHSETEYPEKEKRILDMVTVRRSHHQSEMECIERELDQLDLTRPTIITGDVSGQHIRGLNTPSSFCRSVLQKCCSHWRSPTTGDVRSSFLAWGPKLLVSIIAPALTLLKLDDLAVGLGEFAVNKSSLRETVRQTDHPPIDISLTSKEKDHTCTEIATVQTDLNEFINDSAAVQRDVCTFLRLKVWDNLKAAFPSKTRTL